MEFAEEEITCQNPFLQIQILASKLINEKAGSESTIQLASNGPSPLTVQIVKKDTCRALFPGVTPIPAEQLGHLTSTLNLSLNQAKKAATIIRSWKVRNSIETAAIDSLRSKDKDLKDFFDTKQLELMKTGGESVTRDVVFCVDVEGLIHYLLEARNVEGDHTIKIGIDGGGDFFKICMNIMVEDEEEITSKRMKYPEGAFSKDSKSGSVKKLIILAICQEIPENYENLKSILAIMDLDQISFISALDMKLALIMFGLSGASATFPCVWCDLNKLNFLDNDRNEARKLRTIGSIKNSAAEYQEAAKKHKRKTKLSAAPYKGCQHDPLVALKDSAVIIDVLPPMELHLLLGIVNRLFNHLNDILIQIPGNTMTAEDWSTECALVRPKLHGGEFNGNSCKILLNSVDKLEKIVPKENNEVQQVVKVLKDFKTIKDMCFGKEVKSGYRVAIKEFEASYKLLGISVTPKVHAVLDHIKDFFVD